MGDDENMPEKSEKKIDIAKQTIEKHIDFLRCPLCGAAFAFDNYSLKCQNNHAYDIARKGYMNLFNGYTKIIKTYDKKLFAARKIISDSGLYARLCEKLCEILAPLVKGGMSRRTGGIGAILDAGCGCGNLTADIFNNTGRPLTFAVDLSKDGIDFAASNFCEKDLLWIVGNLNELPIADDKIDVILNIMSPANYAEFIRVLKPGGVLLKVLPDSDYLKELRRFIYQENDKNEYSNKDVLSNLSENMTVSEIIDVNYTHKIPAENIPALFDMTPLTLNISEREKIRGELTKQDNLDVTLAFKIAVCKI